MTEDKPPQKDDIVINAAKKGGKELLAGFSKASLLFTKRMAEGAFNAQIAQSQATETTDKIKVAGSELGRAFVRGAIEGASETLSGIINGVNAFSKEVNKNKSDGDLDALES